MIQPLLKNVFVKTKTKKTKNNMLDTISPNFFWLFILAYGTGSEMEKGFDVADAVSANILHMDRFPQDGNFGCLLSLLSNFAGLLWTNLICYAIFF